MAGKTKKRERSSAASASKPQVEGQTQVKGHLGLKSSPFCTVSSKLTAQVLVQDHMTAHYRMVNRARSTIDNKAPKAWLSSQKVQDRARRENLKKEGPVKANWTVISYRPESQNLLRDYEDMLDIEAPDDYPEYNATYAPQATGQQSSVHVEKIIRNRGLSPRASRPAHDTDLLATKSHVFTEPERPFTPRTLKNKNVQSRLSQFKYYNPPKHQTAAKSVRKSAEKTEPYSCTSTPLPDAEITQELLQSHDQRFLTGRSKEQNVPPLDITADTDHMNWLQEQAANACKRAKPVPPPRTQRKSLKNIPEKNSTAYHTLRDTSASHSSVDEELKYLDFIRDVTNDVLERGIFSNRVLKSVFEKHVQRHKNDLKVSRMRELLDTLRDDLGIPLVDEEMENDMGTFRSGVYKTSNLNESLNKMTLYDTATNNYNNASMKADTLSETALKDNNQSFLSETARWQKDNGPPLLSETTQNNNDPSLLSDVVQWQKDNDPPALSETAQWQNDINAYEKASSIGSGESLDGLEADLLMSKTIRQPFTLQKQSSSMNSPQRKGSVGLSQNNEMEKTSDMLLTASGLESTMGMDSTVTDTLAWGTGTSVWSEVAPPNPLNETHLVQTNKTVHFEEKNKDK